MYKRLALLVFFTFLVANPGAAFGVASNHQVVMSTMPPLVPRRILSPGYNLKLPGLAPTDLYSALSPNEHPSFEIHDPRAVARPNLTTAMMADLVEAGPVLPSLTNNRYLAHAIREFVASIPLDKLLRDDKFRELYTKIEVDPLLVLGSTRTTLSSQTNSTFFCPKDDRSDDSKDRTECAREAAELAHHLFDLIDRANEAVGESGHESGVGPILARAVTESKFPALIELLRQPKL